MRALKDQLAIRSCVVRGRGEGLLQVTRPEVAAGRDAGGGKMQEKGSLAIPLSQTLRQDRESVDAENVDA